MGLPQKHLTAGLLPGDSYAATRRRTHALAGRISAGCRALTAAIFCLQHGPSDTAPSAAGRTAGAGRLYCPPHPAAAWPGSQQCASVDTTATPPPRFILSGTGRFIV